jgi:hypothetical protein
MVVQECNQSCLLAYCIWHAITAIRQTLGARHALLCPALPQCIDSVLTRCLEEMEYLYYLIVNNASKLQNINKVVIHIAYMVRVWVFLLKKCFLSWMLECYTLYKVEIFFLS